MYLKYSSVTYESCFKRFNYYCKKFDDVTCIGLKVKVMILQLFMYFSKIVYSTFCESSQTVIEVSTRDISWAVKPTGA
jgi:hypothetical protein